MCDNIYMVCWMNVFFKSNKTFKPLNYIYIYIWPEIFAFSPSDFMKPNYRNGSQWILKLLNYYTSLKTLTWESKFEYL